MALYVGLDIGGTKLLVASADEQGTILQKTQEPTPLDRDEGVALLMTMISRVTEGAPITAIGAAIGGPLHWKRGLCRRSINPSGEPFRLRR